MTKQLPNDADGDALRRLIATGSDLTKEMEIDFAIDVADQATGLAIADIVQPMGFRTQVNSFGETGRWTCLCSRIMVPTYDDIIAIQKTLENVGRPYNAKPDGWGSFGNSDRS